jgi:hypothetical protein
MAANPVRPLELDLLCLKLDNDYSALIVGTGTDDNARRSNFLSKAVAAFVLHEATGASAADAVEASIDGGADHGIDSVFIAADHTIWLVQSKYIDSGTGEPVLDDVSKFRDGVADLLHGKMDRFNDALQNRQAALTNALNNEVCKIEVVLAHTGGAIHDDRRHIFGDLERGFNGTNPGFVRCRAFGLATLHDLHLDGASADPIDAEVELKDFGYANTPYRAFYGSMNVKRLVELWNDHQEQLVDRNIRRFKGATTVNAGLSETLKTEAEHFFYFNNGVTFLCQAIAEQHPRDANRQAGKFRVRGMSIINGAQTVGAIAQESVAHYDEHPAEVLATFVCLENAPDDFGDRVTQSRNRQNAVDLEDFAVLDERRTTGKTPCAWRVSPTSLNRVRTIRRSRTPASARAKSRRISRAPSPPTTGRTMSLPPKPTRKSCLGAKVLSLPKIPCVLPTAPCLRIHLRQGECGGSSK